MLLRKIGSRPSSRSGSKEKIICALILGAFFSGSAFAARLSYSPAYSSYDEKKSPYRILETKAGTIASSDHTEGWSYIISGGIALSASIPAYYLSDDIFAKAI